MRTNDLTLTWKLRQSNQPVSSSTGEYIGWCYFFIYVYLDNFFLYLLFFFLDWRRRTRRREDGKFADATKKHITWLNPRLGEDAGVLIEDQLSTTLLPDRHLFTSRSRCQHHSYFSNIYIYICIFFSTKSYNDQSKWQFDYILL